ncbi:hypothetical protein MGG_17032 [Pyricularia oryzae 70-15]|uniref:Uncharacterized protein n=1 Tax=Pyricularia oryzae (strain 70-15 / ATCC MYA-4617 / FGSC 8958) TaxID=242507 RepID=G4N5T9_PYRO7|nr:uncharacterized protein MGG_17032 [Pyricularia oryzae 70-15]EHA49715.1 hypothetical protein MGG_17032 [Pyricularia oryzae 70-15]
MRRRFCVCVCSFHPGQIGDGGGCTRRLFGGLALQVVEPVALLGVEGQVDESNAEGLCRTMDCSKSLVDRYPITGMGDTGHILIGFQTQFSAHVQFHKTGHADNPPTRALVVSISDFSAANICSNLLWS